MIRHFYLLYYNFIKWQERTKTLNNERKTVVAEFYTMLIIFLWCLFLYFSCVKLFNLDINYIEKLGKLKFVIIVTIIFVLIRFIVLKLFKATIINIEDEFNQIRNWKNSKYRKRALFYTVFYFIFFIPLMILFTS